MIPDRLSANEIADAVIAIRTPDTFSYLPFAPATRFVEQNYAMHGTKTRDVHFIANELIMNAVDWGNRQDTSKLITIGCAWKGERFYFYVKDEGDGFDIENPEYIGVCGPDGGLGLYTSEQRCELLYNFKDNAAYVCIR